MKLTTISSLFAILLLASCSSNEKKVMLLGTRGSSIDEATKTITVSGSSGIESKEVLFTDGDKITLQVKADSKQTGIDIPTNGYYLINVTNDTIVGSYVTYSAPKTTRDSVSQETIKKSIDSLTQLIEGKNISAANRNYFIPPNTAVKVTENTKAIMVAPFHQMTSIEKEGDKDPEVYRFYTIKEIREKIAKQTEMTIFKAPEPTPSNNGSKKN